MILSASLVFLFSAHMAIFSDGYCTVIQEADEDELEEEESNEEVKNNSFTGLF